jgi:hypothetical protein
MACTCHPYKVTLTYLHTAMGSKILVRKISLNARNFFSVRLSAEGMTCPQACTVTAWSLIVKRWTLYSGAWQQRITDSPYGPNLFWGKGWNQVYPAAKNPTVSAWGGDIMTVHRVACNYMRPDGQESRRATWHLCSHVTSASVTMLCLGSASRAVTLSHVAWFLWHDTRQCFINWLHVKPEACDFLSVEPNPSWEANSSSATQEFPTKHFITLLTRTCHWPLSWARWIQSVPRILFL